jgi:hypothetical protein
VARRRGRDVGSMVEVRTALGPIMVAPTGVGLTALVPTEDLTAGDGRMRGTGARRHSGRSRRWFNSNDPLSRNAPYSLRAVHSNVAGDENGLVASTTNRAK